jgi:two-component system, OmpR family, sensor histidine kinase ArlS
MPVRLRITLLFVIIVMIILTLVCGGIYYFSYTARENNINRRLTNRAITTARLLGQREIFDQRLVQRIDSLTTLALKNKVVQAYDYQNKKIYSYSDVPHDTLHIVEDVLDDARVKGAQFFKVEEKEAVAFHYSDQNTRIVVVSAAEDVEGKESLQTLRNILVAGFLVGTTFVLVTGYIFSASLLLPVKKIAADVEEISAHNLTRRIKTGTTKDEWYQLSNTLNRLLNRLQESFELQRRFISNASHELSTPLTSISSQLEVSLQREREAGEYKQVMQSIYQDVRHMSKLVQTLLEFAKASGNTAGLEIAPVRIDEILLRMPAEMAKLNKEYNVALSFIDLPDDEARLLVYGNEALLFTAIRNIVLNACKYSGNHLATIRLHTIGNTIHVDVTDTGKGIPRDKLKTIFQPFYRVEENIATEGFGLGLSLAEKIIKLHKGTLEVSSTTGVGSTFSITFPASISLSASEF